MSLLTQSGIWYSEIPWIVVLVATGLDLILEKVALVGRLLEVVGVFAATKQDFRYGAIAKNFGSCRHQPTIIKPGAGGEESRSRLMDKFYFVNSRDSAKLFNDTLLARKFLSNFSIVEKSLVRENLVSNFVFSHQVSIFVTRMPIG